MRVEHWLYAIPLRLRSIFQRARVENELDEEIRDHIERETQKLVADGMSAELAARTAWAKFGGLDLIKEDCRDRRRVNYVEHFIQDLRYGVRQMRRSPGFASVAVLTLALGIGANTAIFSVVYSVLLKPLPYPSGERLVWLGESTGKAAGISVTYINFKHWRTENRSFDDIAAFTNADLTMTGRGDAQLTHAGVVTYDFLRLTGTRSTKGRLFTEADDRPGAPLTVVVSGEFWAGTLAGDPNVIGETLALNGKAFQIIGVLKPGLKFFTRPVDLYLPMGVFVNENASRSKHGSIRALGLLRPGVGLAAAKADLDGIMERLALADPGPENDHRAFAEYLRREETGDVRQPLLFLMGAVGLILALAGANVASLMLVRSSARAGEIAIRKAIGAGRFRIARQLLTENLLIAAFGGFFGVVLAQAGVKALVLAGPKGIPRLTDAGIDAPVLIFATALAVIVGLAAGLAPVLASGKAELNLALKENSPGGGAGSRGNLLRGGLVVVEIAITLVLLFASGLLVRSLIAAETRYPGFDDPGHLLALEVQLPPSRYKSQESIRRLYGELAESLRAEPGVEGVGAVTCPPSAGDCGDYWYSILGRPAPARGDVPVCLFNTADKAYFDTMRIPVVSGRTFSDRDTEGGPPVAVVNETLARKWWPAPQLAIGQQIKMGGPYMDGPTYQIVGVVGDVSQMGLDAEPMPEVYYSFTQQARSAMVVMIRTAIGPSSLMPAVKSQLAEIDRDVPIQSLRPFEEWLGSPLKQRRFTTMLLVVFTVMAVTLATIGVYGVLNYWVGVRQKEIAIRMALGAGRSAIFRWTGLQAVRLGAVGITLGALMSWAASRWLKSLLFGVSASDPRIIIGAALAVTAAATLAIIYPLLRAMRVDAARNLH